MHLIQPSDPGCRGLRESTGGLPSMRACPVSPVSVEEGLAQTLGAGLMEPLEAAPALQHFQVPPGGETALVALRQPS
jgi:hypothetical protein